MVGEASGPGPIHVTCRIAVTGHRWIPEADDAVMAVVSDTIERIFRRVTELEPADQTIPLAVVSCLAEGADRIVARVGLGRGARLEVVLPMAPADYQEDFATPQSRADFLELLARSSATTVLPGETDQVEAVSQPDDVSGAYAKAGAELLTRCDILLGLWDGRPSAGIGGTAYLIGLAERLNIPVVKILVGRDGVGEVDEQDFDTIRPLVRRATYRQLERFNRARATESGEDRRAGSRDDTFAQQVRPYFHKADAVATSYRDLVRWASRAVYGLAFLAVATVATQLIFFDTRPRLAWVEATILVLLIGVLFGARRMRVVARWTSTRMLAERLFSAICLAEMGTPPISIEVRTFDDDESRSTDWVGRALQEICFSASFTASAPFDLEAVKAGLTKEWVDPQIRYQTRLHESMELKHKVLGVVGLALFAVSLSAAVLHATEQQDEDEQGYEYFAYLSLVVPALGASITGYAAQRDFLRQSRRAHKTSRDLTHARTDLSQVTDLAGLRVVTSRIDLIMQGDSADWYTIAATHDIELP